MHLSWIPSRSARSNLKTGKLEGPTSDEDLARSLLPLCPHRHPGRRGSPAPIPARPASSNWAGCWPRNCGPWACSDAEQDEHGIVLATVPGHRGAPRPDDRLDRPCRHLAGDQRPQRQADRPSPTTTATTSSCPAIRPRCSASPTIRSCEASTGKTHHHHRRHDAARRRRQGRRRRHHGGGGSSAGPSGDSARADPHLLHLRRGDRPRRRSRRSEETRRPRSATRSTAAARAKSTAKPSPPTWPWSRSPASTFIRRSPRAGWSTPCAWRGCSSIGCRGMIQSPETTDGPRGLSASLSHRGRRGRGDHAHPAARFRHAASWPSRRTCCGRLPHGDGGVSEGEDRRAGDAAISQHGRRPGARSRGRWRSPRRRCGGRVCSRS